MLLEQGTPCFNLMLPLQLSFTINITTPLLLLGGWEEAACLRQPCEFMAEVRFDLRKSWFTAWVPAPHQESKTWHLQENTNYRDSNFILHVKKKTAEGNIGCKVIISKIIKYFTSMKGAKDLIFTLRNPLTQLFLTSGNKT